MNPDRRRLRRGETVETCSPVAGPEGGPGARGRPLGRCHTLDPGEETAGVSVGPPAGHAPQESGPDQTDAVHAPAMPPHLPRHIGSETHCTPPDPLLTTPTADTPASPCPTDGHTAGERATDLYPSEGATAVL